MNLQTVLHVIPAAPFGGAQRLAIDLAHAQSRANLDAQIWYTNAGSVARDIAIAAGLKVVSPFDGGGAVWRRLKALRSVLRSGSLDIVHLHLPPPWLAVDLPRGRKFALVTHLHVQPLQAHARTATRYFEAKLNGVALSRSDVLLSVSRWIEDAWRSAYPKLTTPIEVVYNGISIPSETILHPRRSGTVLGVATRLADRKGVEEFIDLAARVRALAPHLQFRVAGDGPMRADYERRASELGLGDAISFLGFMSDTTSLWQDVDIAVFTSPCEPFGLRLIEPLAHGVPVIAYRNGSGSDEVIERCRGIVAVDYGRVEELATAAVALSRSPLERKRLAEEGIADLRRSFSIDGMEANIRGIYGELCSSSYRDH